MSLDQALAAFNVSQEPDKTLRETIDPTTLVAYSYQIPDSENPSHLLRALERINQDLDDPVLHDVVRGLRQNTNQVVVSIPQDDPRGLRNIGNTCYLNSLLQLLFTITPVREFAKVIGEDETRRQTESSDPDAAQKTADSHNDASLSQG